MNRLTISLLLFLAVPLEADIVTLNNGTRLDGRVKRTPDGYVITDAAGAEKFVAASDVQSVELKKVAATPASAEQSLASLRRAVENLPDPAEAVQRYKAFLAQNAGTPAATSAQADLSQWQQRADKHLTKVGERWVSQEELAQLQASGNAAAQQLLPTLQGAAPAATSSKIDQALVASPNSPALLYLKGVVSFRQGQLPAARKAFEAVAMAFPQHAPTHNNLAVILYQTHAAMPALLEYDKAMLADPNNRQILDNVAEALHGLALAQAKSELATKVAAHFNEQDAVLQGQMASQGLKRLGSQWVSEAEFARLEAAQGAAQRQQEAYKTAAALQARIQQIDQQIAADTQTMNLMSQQMTQQNAGVRGRQAQAPLVQQGYYQLQQQVQALTQEREAKQRQLDQLPRPDPQLQQAATTQPASTGKQSIFDEKSLPGAPPPATRPAVQP